MPVVTRNSAFSSSFRSQAGLKIFLLPTQPGLYVNFLCASAIT